MKAHPYIYPKLYHMVVASATEAEREIQIGAPYTGGKHVYITETGIEYQDDRYPPLVHKVCDLGEALSHAGLYHLYLHKGIELINYWYLFDDVAANGVLEGVAWDTESNEIARKNPHKRPAFHVLKAYRRNVFDELVSVNIEGSPTFTEGPEGSGLVFG